MNRLSRRLAAYYTFWYILTPASCQEGNTGAPLWRLWLEHHLQKFDQHKRQIEQSLLDVGLALVNRKKNQQQIWEEEKQWLVSLSDKDAKNCRRIARAFRPQTYAGRQYEDEENEDQSEDKDDYSPFAVELRATGEISAQPQFICDEMETTDPFEGMVLQVHNVQDSKVKSNVDCLGDGVSDTPQAFVETATGDAYELVEPVHSKLGIVPKHIFDYAYRPVAATLVQKDLPDKEAAQWDDNTWRQWFLFKAFASKNAERDQNSEYEQMGDHAFAGGSHGEVWRARHRCDTQYTSKRLRKEGTNCNSKVSLIMKRLKVEHGFPLLEAGLREVYFGSLLNQEIKVTSLFTKYVDHFFREVSKPFMGGVTELELWIVFEDAGRSLRSYLYTPISSGTFLMYQHSQFWTKLRMDMAQKMESSNGTSVAVTFASIYERKRDGDEHSKDRRPQNNGKDESIAEGKMLVREILRQILSSAAFLHERGVVHRDIKPSNIMCKDTRGNDVKDGVDLSSVRCVLGDLSSGWDRFTSQNLYRNGPSAGEQTDEYAPPEVLLAPMWLPFYETKPQSYDSWSIGVLALELLLGTPNVFSVDQRTTALLTHKMAKEGASSEEIQRAIYLAALSQFCIYMPTLASVKSWPLRAGDPLHKASMTKQSCTLQDFHQALRARDPLGLGFDSSSDRLLNLIWGLLAWDPMDRITASEALKHPYFSAFDIEKDNTTASDHTAIESQMLDPRMDFNVSNTIDKFVCQKCKRKFHDWKSCQKHTTTRRHTKFCTYDRSTLPTCLNAHSMLPSHPTSGYCDIQGRRRVIEDFHAVQLHPTHQFYGMFDGHTGNLASKYAASSFYGTIYEKLNDLDQRVIDRLDWKDSVREKMEQAFADIHDHFLEAVTFIPRELMDQSGTTATILYVTNQVVLVASIGDSRAVLSSQKNSDSELLAIQLTVDHVASNPDEKKLVESRGGFISSGGGTDRVNGILAVTRSIGDADLSSVLSREPYVVTMTRDEMKEQCGPTLSSDSVVPCFVVLASDGLWDVMSNQEAVDLVAEVVKQYDVHHDLSWDDGGAFQEAAQILTQEAYMRGSTDNIGVCVVAID